MGVTLDIVPQTIVFGPFRLYPEQRLLERDGRPVSVGDRALDLLYVLAARAGEVVTKKELLERAWPNLTVDESSLRFHISNLRRTIGDGEAGARYIANVSGRGYCFVGGVQTGVEATIPTEPENTGLDTSLPLRSSPVIGRDDDISKISAHLVRHRMVTIHGPGGVGKTTVAVAVANAQIAEFGGDVHFCDLGRINDPALVPSVLASLLGLAVQSADPVPRILSYLRKRRAMIVLDSCEHLIEAVAGLASKIYQGSDDIQILLTSQEPLRIDGEFVYRLPSLESPPPNAELSARGVLDFPAARLFADRAFAAGYQTILSDADALLVGEICRKLDGIALAIELAAGKASAYGLQEISDLLDSRLRLEWHGNRSALARHQTLSSTLDWSYNLLNEMQRAVFRRLSVFAGSFPMEAAQIIAAGDDLDPAEVADAIGQLVTKSMLSVTMSDGATGYRMLNTTQAYGGSKLVESGEHHVISRHHAMYYQEMLEGSSPSAHRDQWRILYEKHLYNVRRALTWCFSTDGDIKLGCRLASISARLFLEMSLFIESLQWAGCALDAMDEQHRGTLSELELRTALGVSMMYTRGNTEQAHQALASGMELAEKLGDKIKQLYLIGQLHIFYRRAGKFQEMLQIAQKANEIADALADPTALAIGSSLLGVAHHLTGDQLAAQRHLEASLAWAAMPGVIRRAEFSFYPHRTRIALTRTLWLRGRPDSAAAMAIETAEDASFDDPMTQCIAFGWCTTVLHWTGDLEGASEYIDRMIACAEQYSLAQYRTVGLGMRGENLLRKGEVRAGMILLRGALEGLRADSFELYTAAMNSSLAEGLAITASLDQAGALIDQTFLLSERNGNMLYGPDLLRLRGVFLQQAGKLAEAEVALREALALATVQSAMSWELRTTIGLARLLIEQGRILEAKSALADCYSKFSEGFETADLRAAKDILTRLS